jgi:hypothetical protein
METNHYFIFHWIHTHTHCTCITKQTECDARCTCSPQTNDQSTIYRWCSLYQSTKLDRLKSDHLKSAVHPLLKINVYTCPILWIKKFQHIVWRGLMTVNLFHEIFIKVTELYKNKPEAWTIFWHIFFHFHFKIIIFHWIWTYLTSCRSSMGAHFDLHLLQEETLLLQKKPTVSFVIASLNWNLYAVHDSNLCK